MIQNVFWPVGSSIWNAIQKQFGGPLIRQVLGRFQELSGIRLRGRELLSGHSRNFLTLPAGGLWARKRRPRWGPTGLHQMNLVTKSSTWVHYHALQSIVGLFWPCSKDSYPDGNDVAVGKHIKYQWMFNNVRWIVCSGTFVRVPALYSSVYHRSPPIFLFRVGKPPNSTFFDKRPTPCYLPVVSPSFNYFP